MAASTPNKSRQFDSLLHRRQKPGKSWCPHQACASQGMHVIKHARHQAFTFTAPACGSGRKEKIPMADSFPLAPCRLFHGQWLVEYSHVTATCCFGFIRMSVSTTEKPITSVKSYVSFCSSCAWACRKERSSFRRHAWLILIRERCSIASADGNL